MNTRHFLTLEDISTEEFKTIIRRGIELKGKQKKGEVYQPFVGKTMSMVFDKSSTRTRLSFEVGMAQFGGHAIFLSPKDTQMGRGEPIADSARVLSSMTDIIMIRTYRHGAVEELAKNSSVPVINGLTDDFHPCQLLADMMTYCEKYGDIAGKTVTWIGDGNNICQSYIVAAGKLGFTLNICCPEGYEPKQELLEKYSKHINMIRSPEKAVKNSVLVVTDVWASMGQEEEQQKRMLDFADMQVTEQLLDKANENVAFMHCLPAHRGEEVSETLLDDSRSLVWEEAENRLHAQKALIELLLT